MIEDKKKITDPTLSLSEYTKRVLITVIIVGGAYIIITILTKITMVLLLVFASILTAIFIDGVANAINKYTLIPRKWALTLTVMMIVAFLVGTGWFVGPDIATQFEQLTDRIPRSLETIQESLLQYEWYRELMKNTPSIDSIIPSASGVIEDLTSIVSSTVVGILSFIIVFFVGIYLAVNPNVYIDNVINLLPKPKRGRAYEVAAALAHALRWWLVGRFTAMLVIGVLVTIGFWIIDLPFALTLGIITALLSFIPFIGPFLSYIPAVLVALLESPMQVLYVSIVYFAIQILESYFITPNIEHKAVFIPPALLISMQILMGALMGIMGVLFATPLAVVFIILIQMLYVRDVLGDSIKILGKREKKVKENGMV